MIFEKPFSSSSLEINTFSDVFIYYIQNRMIGNFLHSVEIPKRSCKSENEMCHMEDKGKDPYKSDKEKYSQTFSCGVQGEIPIR